MFIHHICNNICNLNSSLIVGMLWQPSKVRAAKGHTALRVVTAPMATIYCREHAAAFTIMRNPFVDKATTKPSITASTLPIYPKYISRTAAAAEPPLHCPSPHINSAVFFLTSLPLNHIKDFQDYYYKCKITSAHPPAAGAVMCTDHCVLKSIFLRIRGATVHKLIKA